MAACVSDLGSVSGQVCDVISGNTYHVPPEIGFFIFLEPFEVLEDSSTGVLDVFFGDLKSLFELIDG